MFNSHKKPTKVPSVELSAFPHHFILTPRNEFRCEQGKKLEKSRVVLSRTETRFPPSRWNLKGLPSWTGLPDHQHAIRPRVWAREDTFDQDYMMPGRVREILESEGLAHGVIENAIGRAEKRHRKALRTMAEQQWLPLRSKETLVQDATAMSCPHSTTEQTNVQSTSHFPDNTEHYRRLPENVDIYEELTDCPERTKGLQPIECPAAGQLENDRAKWVSDQHSERLFMGNTFVPPRVVLVSSKVGKCHLLSKVYLEDGVIPITYDFETWSLTDILDAVSQKLEKYRRNCKARSIMVLCQGGPGYIYLVRNYVITPQKLNKPSYRRVVEFWKGLGNLVSKLDQSEAAIHMFGFRLTDSEQGIKLLPMLQALMYPNRVRVEAANDDTDAGRAVAERYFKYNRYKTWKMHQNTSVTEIDFDAEIDTVVSSDNQEKRSTPKLSLT